MFRPDDMEMRAVILAPIGRDATLLAGTLNAAEIDAAIARNGTELIEKLSEGAGAALVADEAITPTDLQRLASWVGEQPPWSDLPIVIMTSSGRPSRHSRRRAEEFSSLGNFTLLERPLRPETVQSVMKAALRGRMRQYEIRSRQEALLRANADLEQFAHSASHDLKEPLRNIKIFSELLEQECGPVLSAKGSEFLGLVRSSANRMEGLLEGLLSYARASNIGDELPVPISSRKSLDTALQNLASAIEESGATITVGAMPSVRMQEVHLAQLFQNVVGNAIKYRKPAGSVHINISTQQNGNRWRFSIADNGIGIPPEYREAIFGIFKRLHTNGEYAGTGMGLAICQRIVERYRGRIWVDSEPGGGSDFQFTVPA